MVMVRKSEFKSLREQVSPTIVLHPPHCNTNGQVIGFEVDVSGLGVVPSTPSLEEDDDVFVASMNMQLQGQPITLHIICDA